jgi:hypothetical protein
MTLSISILCHYSESRYAECHVSFNVVLNVIMLSVVMPSVVMLKVIMLSFIMLSVVRLSVIMLSVVMLNVVAPFWHNLQTEWEKSKDLLGTTTLSITTFSIMTLSP